MKREHPTRNKGLARCKVSVRMEEVMEEQKNGWWHYPAQNEKQLTVEKITYPTYNIS